MRRKPSTSTKKSSGSGSKSGSALTKAFEGHGPDVVGSLAILLAVISGLGIYGGVGGPTGEAMETAFGSLVGLLRYLAPPLLAVLGAAVVMGNREEHEPPLRAIVGSVLVAAAVCGFLHLAIAGGTWQSTEADLVPAGGLAGAAVGGGLRSVVGMAGAYAAVVVVAALGLVVITGTPLRVVGERVAATVGPPLATVGGVITSLFRSNRDEDQPDERDEAAAPRRSRRRRSSSAPDDDTTEIDLTDGADGEHPAGGGPFDYETDGRLSPRGGAEGAGSANGATPPSKPPAPSPQVKVREPDPEPPDEPTQLRMQLDHERDSPWALPPATLLKRTGAQEVDRKAVEETGRTLERALGSHGVETRLVGMVVGPTVTRFELELGPGVKVARVTSLHKDIAYAMASPDVRILAPIPGRQAIGVEVPNTRREIVAVGDILSSDEARKATHPLEVAVGRDISGRAVLANLATMPHLLIAGATGAGKSSCINSLITSLLMRSTPDQVRMILVDPKRVELGQYNGLPHLLTQVVTNPKRAANALSWAVKEMERRYDLLSEVGVRDITGYNEAFDRGDFEGERSDVMAAAVGPEGDASYPRLPFVVIVVDELNDLMMVAARDVEESIVRISQMARAVGIHLVIATQRPSVNVITGVIKANIPARLAFAVSSLADSRVILDQPGAERLVGKGDMLLLGPTSSAPKRVQGCWVTEEEVRSAVGHWRRQAPEVAYVEGVEGSADDDRTGAGSGGGGGSGDDDDDLLAQARDLVVRSQLGSTSMLQRKLRVGFARAGRIMDLLEQQGVVGPSTGSKAREVLMTPEELDALEGGGTADPDGDGVGDGESGADPDDDTF
ncbi:MAG: DNA translocase FtsK [Actinomycetota bacterium]|nr:DNA translocase FtsK [Actinomycetota bacterium]